MHVCVCMYVCVCIADDDDVPKISIRWRLAAKATDYSILIYIMYSVIRCIDQNITHNHPLPRQPQEFCGGKNFPTEKLSVSKVKLYKL